MPAAVTHSILAGKVLEYIKSHTSLKVDEKIYFYGAQGPDFFFTHRFLPWQKGVNLREYANKIHNADPNKVLMHMKEYVMTKKSKKAVSYFLGFICHYSLDSTAHPYIEYITDLQVSNDDTQSEKVFHCESEAVLDTIVYYRETGKLASTLDMSMFFDHNNDDKVIVAEIYQYLIKKLFGKDIDALLIEQAVVDSKQLFRYLNDKSGAKKMIMGRLEKNKKRNLSCYLVPNKIKNHVDYANMDEEMWVDRHGNERNENFFELLKIAEDKASDIISNLSTRPIECLSDNEHF